MFNPMRESINVAIAGATGYIGLELINILKNHPKVKIRYLLSKNFDGKNIKKFDQRIGRYGAESRRRSGSVERV